ncbi:ribonuclease P protein component [Nitrosomonas sp. Nm166]|uniref:ribonuclease P protein component n=1 Tax=Nitrosomonas sp. Nm166 TaxID=1881054 RepID=UPI00210B4D41|nr:ribonuclease P protein component [Nitrosomonas sp. Nm166]
MDNNFIFFKFAKIHSLPSNCRLHKAIEFSAVINFKYRASGNLIQVYAKPNDLLYARIGLIVSKRIEPHAVKRNWIKRILRETFRKSQHNDAHFKKMDWVIRVRRSVTKNDSTQLVAETQLLMVQLQQCHD